MAFTGSFLGAGFVSGQELTQFFAVFGSWGVLGMFFAVLMLFVLGCLVMKMAKRTGFTEFDKIIVEKEIPWLRAVFGGVFIFFSLWVGSCYDSRSWCIAQSGFCYPNHLGKCIDDSIFSLNSHVGS